MIQGSFIAVESCVGGYILEFAILSLLFYHQIVTINHRNYILKPFTFNTKPR